MPVDGTSKWMFEDYKPSLRCIEWLKPFNSLLSCQTHRVFPLLTLHMWAQTDLQNDPGVEDLQLQKTWKPRSLCLISTFCERLLFVKMQIKNICFLLAASFSDYKLVLGFQSVILTMNNKTEWLLLCNQQPRYSHNGIWLGSKLWHSFISLRPICTEIRRPGRVWWHGQSAINKDSRNV